MKNLTPYELFESASPHKQLTVVTLQKKDDDKVKITLTLDKMNRIDDVRSPSGVRHIFRRGNVLGGRQLQRWMDDNDFVEVTRQDTKRALRGNELVKYMMKKGYR